MKYKFTKNVTAFKEDHFTGDIIDVDPELKDTKTCLREGWLIEVQEVKTSKRVVKRKKQDESI